MIHKNVHILLAIIDRNDNVNSLLSQGLSYLQISELTSSAIDEQLIIYNDNSVVLSEKGKELLSFYRQNLKKMDKDQWIERETSSMIPKIDLEFVFLPNQNELFF